MCVWCRTSGSISYKASFTRSFSLVSKSPIALSATQHPISRTDFLHHLDYDVRHLDYDVPPLHPPVVLHSLPCCWLVTFGVPLSSQNSPFLQVLSSIAFPNSPLARLHGYSTIAGVGTSLMKFSLGSVR